MREKSELTVAGIYIIENMINHCLYIGRSNNIGARWSQHKSDARRCRDNSALHAAMREFGEENFQIRILETLPEENYIKDSPNKERYWISIYNTYLDPKHYNLTEGGDGTSRKMSEEEKLRQSEREKAWYQTPEGKAKAAKHSEYMKQHPVQIHNPHTEEWKKQHSERMKGSNNPNYGKHTRGRACKCIELNQVFPSMRNAALTLQIPHVCVERACKGIQNTAGGYHWEFVEKDN